MPTARAPQPRTRAKTGRTTKKTDARVDALCRLLEGGMTRRGACALVEINTAQLYRWLEDDAAFRSAVEKAEAQAEQRFTTIVADAAPDSWQAAAWWLERRRATDYARRDRLELDVHARAQEVAQAYGLNADEVLAEVERWLSPRAS